MKKVNPRRRPASEADVKRAKAKASDDAIRLAMAIFLTVLCDGFDFDKDQIRLAWGKMEKLSQEIAEKRVNLFDLLNVLDTEYEISLR